LHVDVYKTKKFFFGPDITHVCTREMLELGEYKSFNVKK